MSDKVMNDLRSFEKNKPAVLVSHPLYDNFGNPVSKAEARTHLNLPLNEYFGLGKFGQRIGW